MNKLFFYAFFVIVSFSLLTFCEPVLPPPQLEGDLKLVEIPDLEGIPLEYGKLISVTSPFPGLVHFWFEDENLTIRQVEIIYGRRETGYLSKTVREIKRN